MKRSNLAQTNFFSLLAPPVPLSSNIVLLDDPRWPQALQELQQAKHIGFDLEYYGPWQTKKDIDHTRAQIRLIQVGLPSGLVLIADLGTPEQREQQLERYSSFLAGLRPILASREVLKVGQALKGDLVALECNLGITVRDVRDVMLFSQVLWAGVGAAKPKKPKGRPETPEERQRRLKFVGLRHTLQAIAQRTGTPHEDHQDGDQYTGSPYWAGKLTNNDLNIAASRAGVVLPIWRRLCQWVREAELIDSVLAECEALPAFAECEINGLPVDWATLNDAINKWSAARDKVLAVWHETFPKVDPLKKEKVAVALSNALGLTGDDRLYSLGDPGKNGKRKILPRVNDETLIPYDNTTPGNENAEPERAKIYRAVHAYLEHNSIFVQLSYLLGFKKHYYRGSVRSKYFQIAMGSKPGKEFETGKGMGRSSASDPNSQNSPNLQPAHKAAGLPSPRSPVRPPPLHSLILADLAASHARIATQASLDPVLIDIFSSGKDVHCVPMWSEVLTRHGWRTLDSVSVGEDIACYSSGKLIFSPIVDKILQGSRILFEARAKNSRFLSTSLHRNLVVIGNNTTIRHTYQLVDRRADLVATGDLVGGEEWNDRFLRILGFVIGDGTRDGANWKISVSKDRKKDYLRRLLPERKAQDNYSVFVVPSDLTRVIDLFISKQKDPQWAMFLRLSREGLANILDGWFNSDGCHRGNGSYTVNSINKDLLGLFQTMNHLVGRMCRIGADLDNRDSTFPSENPLHTAHAMRYRHPCYAMTYRQTNLREPVGCVSVFSGAFLIRQHDTIIVTGNCVTANGLLSHKGHQFTYEDVHQLNAKFKKYNKALEKGENPAAIPEVCYEVAATRALSKNVFYGSINIQGAPTLKKTGETAAEPVFMTIEQAEEGIKVWRETYHVLHGFQRSTIKKANAFKARFDQPGISPYSLGLPGEYAVVRGLSKRRLFLLKEQDKHGRFSCKGTDCVSFVWMGTEADIIKRAMGRILAEFDQHPEWSAKFRGMAHDDVCVTCLTIWENDVAQCVQREFDEAMKWVIKVIPVSDGDWKSTIVGSWAAK